MGAAGETGDTFLETWELLTAGLGGWSRVHDGTIAAVTGVPLSGLNGVWSIDGEIAPEVLGSMLDDVAAAGVPFCLQVPSAAKERLDEVATDRALVPDHDIPFMRLADPARLGAATVDGLVVRSLSREEVGLHHRVGADGFGAPPEIFEQLLPAALLDRDEVRAYVAEVDGTAVSTGFGVRVGDAVGVFNIATPEPYRRRGYGAAVTARVVEDGLAAGAVWAWLQSSEAGLRVYEGLGFETVDVWSSWETGADR